MNYSIWQLKDFIMSNVKDSLIQAINENKIPQINIPDILLEVPKVKEHGDFATNIAMLITKEAKMPPRKIAEIIVEGIQKGEIIEAVEIAGPGFINFRVYNNWLLNVVTEVLAMGIQYGKTDFGQGRKVQVEFVSANPTGPMHMGNAKGGAIGDALSNLLRMAGYEVSKEFYINDAGNQIENFGRSLEARFMELMGQEWQIPEGGYHGEDIRELMVDFLKENDGEEFLKKTKEERHRILKSYGLERNINKIKNDLKKFGIEFDNWFSEQTLHDSGKVEETIEVLKKNNMAYEKDGALWFKASEYGSEKDEVLVRSNGISTYFAADIAYHKDKFDRGFDWAINLWGADHHGHVARMKGALDAIGYDGSKLDVILMQLVRLMRSGEVVRMSKRTGKSITLADLVEEVGKDAARYFFNMRSAEAHTDFDLDLAVSQSNENPVFYVQYAHARICSILRQIDVKEPEKADQTLLTHPAEVELMRKLADFPEEVNLAAKHLAPHRITGYVHDLAGLFHTFYNACRCIGQTEELTAARISLVTATRQVIKNCLDILGITAPEKM